MGFLFVGDFAAIPGLPVLGNLLQLKEKKPHKTFARWAAKYGPVYSIRTGASTVIVLNTAEVAKEVPITALFRPTFAGKQMVSS